MIAGEEDFVAEGLVLGQNESTSSREAVDEVEESYLFQAVVDMT